MSIEIRTIRKAELAAYVAAMSTAFLESRDAGKVAEELQSEWDLDRTWAALDDGRICGTFRSWPTELTTPGCVTLQAAAISAVTVLPTHRRQGILRRMVAAEHAAARERGDAVGLLYASEYPIYGRFGYGAACRQVTWTIDTIAADAAGGLAVAAGRGDSSRTGSGGRIELVTPDATSRDSMIAVFEAWRIRQPGEIHRRDYRWDYELGLRETAWGPPWKGFLALRRDASDVVDGYVRYHVEEKWEQNQPRNVLLVDELHALTDEAYVTLWRFVVEMDWVSTIKADRRRISELLPWLLTNARAAAPSDVGDGLWVRLLDVSRALEARTYERAARLVLEIADDEAPGGRQRLEIDASPSGASAQATDRSPDLTLHVSALGAAYLGGVSLRDAVLAHGWDEARAGALGEATDLFRTLDEPWCSTFF